MSAIEANSQECTANTEEFGAYTNAIETYLNVATWLTDADAPLRVHARAIAKSLDRQMRSKGEVQSALAGSFDKVLYRLDARRPGPSKPTPSLEDNGPFGEESIFTMMEP